MTTEPNELLPTKPFWSDWLPQGDSRELEQMANDRRKQPKEKQPMLEVEDGKPGMIFVWALVMAGVWGIALYGLSAVIPFWWVR
jgi:hypothetical protein